MSASSADMPSLDRLHDIVLPGPVPWWPPAPGWYVVAALVVVLGVWAMWRWWRQWRANAYRRAALAELEQLVAQSHDPSRRVVALQALPELLKRTALAAFPRDEIASLSGPAWLGFLDHTGGGRDFTSGPGALIPEIAYIPRYTEHLDQAQQEAVIQCVRRWIRKHHLHTA
jgi:ABC-type nickel/cobalt efflux system permease component RcnA